MTDGQAGRMKGSSLYRRRSVVVAASMLALLAGGPAATTAALAADAAQVAPPTTTSVQAIRDAIQAAHNRDGSGPFAGIVPYLGGKVETTHEPKFPNDGVVDGAQLGNFLPFEHSLANAAIEQRRMDVTFTVRGQDIVMKGVLTGRLRGSGKLLVHPVNVVWTVANGRIVRFWVDASTPEIKEGYRLQGEAYSQPAVRPLMQAMMATMTRK